MIIKFLPALFISALLVAGCGGNTGGVMDVVDMTAPEIDMSCSGALPLRCGAACVDPNSDWANCGSCDAACKKDEVCAAGKCALDCPAGLSACGGACVNLLGDAAHCGDCVAACAAGNLCSNGKCALSCQQGLMDCSGQCVNMQSDPANCGACAAACPAGTVCSAGKCATNCQQELMDCGGLCANLASDSANCGACGSVCAPGNVCSNGKCALSCQQGLVNCNGVCVNTLSDNANCGGCGGNCAMGLLCSMGKCSVSCQQGLTNCGGLCANLQTDVANCGSCAAACGPGTTCSAGKCVVTCGPNLTPCNGICVDTVNDAANCGGCGSACPMGSACLGARCQAACAPPLSTCNAVCVDTRFDPDQCGHCGVVCPQVANGSRACLNGVCGVGACNAGFLNCDGAAGNGCETAVGTDPANCGVCGKQCGAVANGVIGCSMGVCGVGACNGGFLNCDGLSANGCEVSANTDVKNCGGCNMVCPGVPNGAAGCAGGKCGVGACSQGFADCDNNGANGCEVNLTNDVKNCSACGAACAVPANATAGCANSVCGVGQCNANFGNCDNNAANGCESNLLTNINNCGACGVACGAVANGTPGCAQGACGIGSCNANFADCDGLAQNGCETNLQTDANNCGQCGMVCPMGQSCSAGQCISQVECQNPVILNDLARNVNVQNGSGCDSNFNGSWYRFVAPAGTQMPTQVVPSSHCSTDATGWMMGALPNVGEGAVARTVCFNWTGLPCWQTAAIQVINCGAYYVYQLPKPLACNYRYCAQ